MFDNMIASLREKSPLIHCITNYVTVSDVANMLLACGASPIMADDACGSTGNFRHRLRAVPQSRHAAPEHGGLHAAGRPHGRRTRHPHRARPRGCRGRRAACDGRAGPAAGAPHRGAARQRLGGQGDCRRGLLHPGRRRLLGRPCDARDAARACRLCHAPGACAALHGGHVGRHRRDFGRAGNLRRL